MNIHTEAVETMERLRAELAAKTEMYHMAVNSVCAALERAGVDAVDDPGEAIDVLVAGLRKDNAVARRTSEYWKAEHLAGNARIKALEDALKWAAAVLLSATIHHHTIKEADAAHLDADNRKTVGEILDMANQVLGEQ